MSNKLQKVLSEIDKVKEKIAVQQTRLRELEQQKTELETMEIVGMVRGLDVAPEELAAFIKAFRGSKAGTPDFMESEDNEQDVYKRQGPTTLLPKARVSSSLWRAAALCFSV